MTVLASETRTYQGILSRDALDESIPRRGRSLLQSKQDRGQSESDGPPEFDRLTDIHEVDRSLGTALSHIENLQADYGRSA